MGCKKLKYSLFLPMIDRALGFGPVQQQSYYFQLIPLYLSIVGKESLLPAEGTTYRFNVWKGQQKFDENKFPIQAGFKVANGVPVMSVASCKLNFYLPNFNRLRKQQFTLRLIQNEKNQDFDIGQYTIDVSQMIEAYKKENKIRYELKTFFSQDYQLDFEVYVEKTRIALEKAIKENRSERISKSPLKSRNVSVENTPSKPPQEELPQRDQEFTSKVYVTEQKQSEVKVEVKVEVQGESKEESSPTQQQNEPEPAKEQVTSHKVETEGSEKNQSVKTGKKVPLVQTKFKQLAKQDTPSEIKMQQSHRLSTSGGSETQKLSNGGESPKEKIMIWLFLLAGIAVMYLAMHPNKRT